MNQKLTDSLGSRAVITVNKDLVCLRVDNPEVFLQSDASCSDCKDRNIRELLPSNIFASLEESWKNAFEGKTTTSDFSIDTKIFLSFTIPGQSPDTAITFIQDVTTPINSINEHKLSTKLITTTDEGIMITDAETRIVKINSAFTRITGFSESEVKGQTPKMLNSGWHQKEFFTNMWEDLEKFGVWQGAVWNRKKTGELYTVWLNINTVKDENNKVINYIGVFNEPTVHTPDQQELETLNYYDPLTNMPKPALFMDRLNNIVAKAGKANGKFAVIVVNIDRFKEVNTKFGHFAGDQLLHDISQRIQSALGQEYSVSRSQSDEFMIVSPEIKTQEDIIETVDKLRNTAVVPVNIEGKDVFISLCMGISIFPYDGKTAQEMVNTASYALKQEKLNPTTNYRFYTEEMNAKAIERLGIENSLRMVIENNELYLQYQPEIDIKTGAIIGAEALVRWKHPKYGIVAPNDFIPLAEQTGLIIPIGEWVLNTAVQQLKQWRPMVPRFTMAVNLSAKQFNQGDLVDVIRRIIANNGIAPSDLELELTEGTIMENVEKSVLILHECKEMGIRISIDDFGTGYSSLSYLKKFPIDKIKIDRSFVMDLPEDKANMAIVKTIVSLIHNLKLTAIAEGIEDERQLEFLRDLECEEGQGYYFSRPLLAQDFEKLLSENKTFGQAHQ